MRRVVGWSRIRGGERPDSGYDPVSGDLLSSYVVPNAGEITGLTHEDDYLYAMDANGTLHILEVSASAWTNEPS
ncbi:MAG: hypothetical protein R3C99_14995 [Pirellulaceae bacterium]